MNFVHWYFRFLKSAHTMYRNSHSSNLRNVILSVLPDLVFHPNRRARNHNFLLEFLKICSSLRFVRIVVRHRYLHCFEVFGFEASKCHHLFSSEVDFLDRKQIAMPLLFLGSEPSPLLYFLSIDSVTPDLTEELANTSASARQPKSSSLNLIPFIVSAWMQTKFASDSDRALRPFVNVKHL